MKKIAYIVDGASSGNGLSAAFGLVLKNAETGETLETYGEHIGGLTNNDAEYLAVICALQKGLQMFKKHKDLKNIIILSDSTLIVKQINGEYKVKEPALRIHWQHCVSLIEKYPSSVKVLVDQVPREYTHEADFIAREYADKGREKEVEKNYPFLTKI